MPLPRPQRSKIFRRRQPSTRFLLLSCADVPSAQRRSRTREDGGSLGVPGCSQRSTLPPGLPVHARTRPPLLLLSRHPSVRAQISCCYPSCCHATRRRRPGATRFLLLSVTAR